MKLTQNNQRLLDLVRYARAVLHEDGLITDEEYADLAAVGSDSARRLEDYDDLRERIKNLEKETNLDNTRWQGSKPKEIISILEERLKKEHVISNSAWAKVKESEERVAKLIQIIRDLFNFANFAKSKGVDPGFYQIGIDKAMEVLTTEERNGQAIKKD